MFELLFRPSRVPGQPDADEEFQILAALRVGSALYVSRLNTMSEAVPRAVAKFHPKRLAKRFRLLFTNDTYYDADILRFNNHLVFLFNATEDISKAFLDDNMHILLIVRAWANLKRYGVFGQTNMQLASTARYV